MINKRLRLEVNEEPALNWHFDKQLLQIGLVQYLLIELTKNSRKTHFENEHFLNFELIDVNSSNQQQTQLYIYLCGTLYLLVSPPSLLLLSVLTKIICTILLKIVIFLVVVKSPYTARHSLHWSMTIVYNRLKNQLISFLSPQHQLVRPTGWGKVRFDCDL